MRADGVEMCRFPSARDQDAGVNVAVFVPGVFGRSAPQGFQHWRCSADRDMVEMTRRDFTTKESMVFARRVFLVNHRLPMPAVE